MEHEIPLLKCITPLNIIEISQVFNNTVFCTPFLVLFDYQTITEKELVDKILYSTRGYLENFNNRTLDCKQTDIRKIPIYYEI